MDIISALKDFWGSLDVSSRFALLGAVWVLREHVILRFTFRFYRNWKMVRALIELLHECSLPLVTNIILSHSGVTWRTLVMLDCAGLAAHFTSNHLSVHSPLAQGIQAATFILSLSKIANLPVSSACIVAFSYVILQLAQHALKQERNMRIETEGANVFVVNEAQILAQDKRGNIGDDEWCVLVEGEGVFQLAKNQNNQYAPYRQPDPASTGDEQNTMRSSRIWKFYVPFKSCGWAGKTNLTGSDLEDKFEKVWSAALQMQRNSGSEISTRLIANSFANSITRNRALTFENDWKPLLVHLFPLLGVLTFSFFSRN